MPGKFRGQSQLPLGWCSSLLPGRSCCEAALYTIAQVDRWVDTGHVRLAPGYGKGRTEAFQDGSQSNPTCFFQFILELDCKCSIGEEGVFIRWWVGFDISYEPTVGYPALNVACYWFLAWQHLWDRRMLCVSHIATHPMEPYGSLAFCNKGYVVSGLGFVFAFLISKKNYISLQWL